MACAGSVGRAGRSAQWQDEQAESSGTHAGTRAGVQRPRPSDGPGPRYWSSVGSASRASGASHGGTPCGAGRTAGR
jgi:hypothetical protein